MNQEILKKKFDIKVELPEPNMTLLLSKSIFGWYVVRFGSKEWHQHDMCLKRIIGLRAQNYANHSRLDSQHDRRDLYGDLMSTRIFSLVMNKIFVLAPKITRQSDTGTTWICESSCTKCVFPYPTRSGPR